MNVGIPCVDPIIYPPVHEVDNKPYPVDAARTSGRQWRPPAAPYIDVPSYRPGFERTCLECKDLKTNALLVTGWLCRACAIRELRYSTDPFAVAHFWHSYTAETNSMTPIDEYQWYRWYGWLATNSNNPVAPIQVFHDLSAACNKIMGLGLITATSTDHVLHYIGRTFTFAEDEAKDAMAAGLIPAKSTTISEVEGIHD